MSRPKKNPIVKIVTITACFEVNEIFLQFFFFTLIYRSNDMITLLQKIKIKKIDFLGLLTSKNADVCRLKSCRNVVILHDISLKSPIVRSKKVSKNSLKFHMLSDRISINAMKPMNINVGIFLRFSLIQIENVSILPIEPNTAIKIL